MASVSVETRPVAPGRLRGRLGSTADRVAGWAWVSSGAAGASTDWGEAVGESVRPGHRAAAFRVWKEAWDASGVGAAAAAD
jgi:hypothetical protein